MEALAAVPVSTLCDVDKSLPVVDPAIRPLTSARALRARRSRSWRRASSCRCCTRSARPRRATCSWCRPAARRWPRWASCWRTEASRRGLGGIVVDGYVRDRTGLPERSTDLGARDGADGGPQRRRAARRRAVLFGGVRVAPGDLVVGDDDGLVIAPRAQLEATLERAAEIERVEAAVLAAVQGGTDLLSLTNLVEHVARLRAGEPSSARDHAAELNSNATAPTMNGSPSPSKMMRRTPGGPSAWSCSGPGSSGRRSQSWPPVPTSTEYDLRAVTGRRAPGGGVEPVLGDDDHRARRPCGWRPWRPRGPSAAPPPAPRSRDRAARACACWSAAGNGSGSSPWTWTARQLRPSAVARIAAEVG